MECSLSLKLTEKEENPPHSDDNRSTKKVKIRENSLEETAANVLMEEQPLPTEEVVCMDTNLDDNQQLPTTEPQKVSTQSNSGSFRDKLVGRGSLNEEEEDIELEEGDVTFGKDGVFPSINFSQRVHRFLEESMKHAIVLKMLGRPIGYRKLREHLLRLWGFTSPFRLSDLEGGCFIVRFSNEVDYRTVLTEGPWMIAGNYLTVHPWTPEFSPTHHTISQVVAWVRIPGLPTKYYKKNVIRAIGRVLGRVLRIDYNTISGERGKFARMAIILDLSNPLTSKITVDGRALLIEYEGLPTICYCCGRYGHLAESCPLNKTEPSASSSSSLHPTSIQEPAARGTNAMEVTETNPYGDWMIAPQRGRRFARDQKKTSESNYQKSVSSGSRFNLLQTHDAQPETCQGPHDQNKEDINLPQHHKPIDSLKEQIHTAKNLTPTKDQKKKPTQQTKPQEKPSDTPNETIFASQAYRTHMQNTTTLDHSCHTAVSHPNPKVVLEATNNPKPITTRPNPLLAPTLEKNKETFLPKPPDRTSPKQGIRLQTGLQMGHSKPKNREPPPTLSDEVLRTITKTLDAQYTEKAGDHLDDTLDEEEDQSHSSMEC